MFVNVRLDKSVTVCLYFGVNHESVKIMRQIYISTHEKMDIVFCYLDEVSHGAVFQYDPFFRKFYIQ